MDRFLRLLEKPQPEAIIDEKKLKSFTSKVSIWATLLSQNRPINFLVLSEKKVCLIDIIESFIENITGQVIFICLLFCATVCCLQFVWFWC